LSGHIAFLWRLLKVSNVSVLIAFLIFAMFLIKIGPLINTLKNCSYFCWCWRENQRSYIQENPIIHKSRVTYAHFSFCIFHLFRIIYLCICLGHCLLHTINYIFWQNYVEINITNHFTSIKLLLKRCFCMTELVVITYINQRQCC